MVRVFDNSYRNYRADQRERSNEFAGWNIHDKFGRSMGSLGNYLANQESFRKILIQSKLLRGELLRVEF